jgi:hypothetical protein
MNNRPPGIAFVTEFVYAGAAYGVEPNGSLWVKNLSNPLLWYKHHSINMMRPETLTFVDKQFVRLYRALTEQPPHPVDIY